MRFAFLALCVITVILLSIACQPLPTPPPSSPSAPPPSALPAPVATRLPALTVTATQTPAPVQVDLIEDCMAGCHPPEPTEYYAAGAAPQPADHKGRTTCLECHATMAKPALPATHLGRMDPGCVTCHQ